VTSPAPVVVVTGAGSGLGRCIAGILGERGTIVAALDIDGDAARETVDSLQGQGFEAFAVEADVTDPASVAAAQAAVLEARGRIDGLVNNAGILVKATLADETLAGWQKTLDINVTGYFLCLQAFGATMREQGSGAIVNIASIGGTRPTIGAGAYCVSKAGVLALTKQAALEWGPSGIRVNAVSPGFMKTAMTQNRYAVDGLEERRASMIPLRRIAPLEDVAAAVAFLLSSDAAYVTGEEILVDGGFVLSTTVNVPQPTST